jgi:rod shape-determining protein MreB
VLDYFKRIIYVQLSPERLTVRDPKTRESISEIPEIAFVREPKPKILAVGKDARSHKSVPSVQIVNPFAHPRSMVSDFTLGEQTLKGFVQRLQRRGILSTAPTCVMHLLGEPAGGYTQVEVRAFQEMLLGAGASRVTIWQGRDLSDRELLSGQFPEGGKVLS